MNQSDKEFILSAIKASKDEVIDLMVSLNQGLKKALMEYVSEEMNGLAHMTAKGFERVDQRIGDLEDNMNSKFEGVHRRIDSIDINSVRFDAFAKLDKRVHKLEKAVA